MRQPFLLFLAIATLIFSVIILVPNYRHYPYDGFKDFILMGGHWLISTVGLFCLIALMSVNRYIFMLLFPVFVAIASATALFTWQFDVSINSALVESIIYTNTLEASSYVSWVLVVFLIFSVGLSVLFVYLRFMVKWTTIQAIVIGLLFTVSFFTFRYVNQIRFNTMLSRNPYSFYLATSEYLKETREISKKRVMVGENAKANTDSIVVVFVIGEALRADHIQMNGYHRVTMPNMEKRGVVSIPHVYSPFTHTAQSLPYILTRANNSFLDPAYNESSFVDAFSNSSFYTAWIGNQNPTKTYRFFVNECDTVFINKPQISDYSVTKKMDSDLIEPFQRVVNKDKAKKLVILHLNGNHWWYNSNYPDSFAVFKPIMQSKIVSAANREMIINSYDNATLFSDFVLDKVIDAIEDKVALLIFLSDHGQSFGEEGKWLHANNTEAEKNPACFVWFSDDYKKRWPEKVENLNLIGKSQVNTSFLFHSILHGGKIKSEFMDSTMSVFSSQFQP